jgi:hypothetical protein
MIVVVTISERMLLPSALVMITIVVVWSVLCCVKMLKVQTGARMSVNHDIFYDATQVTYERFLE